MRQQPRPEAECIELRPDIAQTVRLARGAGQFLPLRKRINVAHKRAAVHRIAQSLQVRAHHFAS